MIHHIFYSLMLIGFGGLSVMSQGWQGKTIGICLLIVNALIFYKK